MRKSSWGFILKGQGEEKEGWITKELLEFLSVYHSINYGINVIFSKLEVIAVIFINLQTI